MIQLRPFWLTVFVTGMVILALGTLHPRGQDYLARVRQDLMIVSAGRAIAEGLAQYYENSPGSVKQYPFGLQDLLSDPRFAVRQQYLTEIPNDPVTGKPTWIEMRDANGAVWGVRSTSTAIPTLIGKVFALRSLDGARHSDWIFGNEPN